MTTYTLNIDSVNCAISKYGLSNVVVGVNWSYVADNGIKNYGVSGTQEVAEPNPLEFTPLEQLTKEIVLTWLENIKDFSQYNEYMVKQVEQVEQEEIITIQL